VLEPAEVLVATEDYLALLAVRGDPLTEFYEQRYRILYQGQAAWENRAFRLDPGILKSLEDYSCSQPAELDDWLRRLTAAAPACTLQPVAAQSGIQFEDRTMDTDSDLMDRAHAHIVAIHQRGLKRSSRELLLRAHVATTDSKGG
jgi:hypothetical protein